MSKFSNCLAYCFTVLTLAKLSDVVTTVFQCIGGIFKILLNIPRLGSSQQVDTAVSDSATQNKQRTRFLSRLLVCRMFCWTSQLYPNGNDPMWIWAESPKKKKPVGKFCNLGGVVVWCGGSNKRDSCWCWSSPLLSIAGGCDLDYQTRRQPRQPAQHNDFCSPLRICQLTNSNSSWPRLIIVFIKYLNTIRTWTDCSTQSVMDDELQI